MPGDDVDEDSGEDAVGASGAPLDDFMQNSDTLDLPDGLEMDEDTARQAVDDEVEDKMLEDVVDGTTSSQDGEDEIRLGSSSPPHPRDDTNEESLDEQRHEGEETVSGLENSHPDGDVSMRPDIRKGDEAGNEAVPDHSLSTNVREDALKSPSTGGRGAKGASMSEDARGDDASVYLPISL
jgi:midasin